MKEKKKDSKGLLEDKDYLTEAWLQGGKAVGALLKPSEKKKKKKK